MPVGTPPKGLEMSAWAAAVWARSTSRNPNAFRSLAPIAARLAQPLDTARFKAARGVVLARLGKRTAAAGETAEARCILAKIDARPYLERVERQLDRLGGRARRHPGTGQLTASEEVVARLVASGLSNKQAAEQLRVSRKAIEFHLASIYVKLQVSSRSQLAANSGSLGTLGATRARKS